MMLSHPSLRSPPARTPSALSLLPDAEDLRIDRMRAHEACGPARHTMALWLAAQTSGPVVWIAPAWEGRRLNSDGIREWINPARIVFVHPRRTEDLLWALEEVLRAGAAALGILDLPAPPNLTQVRRMHLAAETGAHEGHCAPIGLLLTPENGGAPGVQTRWYLAPAHAEGRDGWRLERRRDRTAPVKAWTVCKADHGNGLHLLSG